MRDIKKIITAISLLLFLAVTGCSSAPASQVSDIVPGANDSATGSVTTSTALPSEAPGTTPAPKTTPKGKNNTEKPVKTEKQPKGVKTASVKRTPAPVKTAVPMKVTIAIRCDKAVANWDNLREEVRDERIVPKSGVILQTTSVDIAEGDTVFTVLANICKRLGIQMEYEGGAGSVYIKGIHNLYQFDCGSLSGWMFSVNGKYSDTGSSVYKVKAGERIVWDYTCDLGRDLKK